MQQIYVIISGQVQNVGFRYSTRQRAESLGLTGFVRNLPDRDVEVVAQGKKEDLDKMAEWLKKGPSSAVVRDAKIEWVKPTKIYECFSIEF